MAVIPILNYYVVFCRPFLGQIQKIKDFVFSLNNHYNIHVIINGHHYNILLSICFFVYYIFI